MRKRDYLYLWNDPGEQFVVASGVTFADVTPLLGPDRSLVLLAHGAAKIVCYDERSGLSFVSSEDIPLLLRQDIYSYGDFCWFDFVGNCVPEFTEQEIAELLYFGHRAKFLEKSDFPTLRNRFFCYAHDDGWYLKLCYRDWAHIRTLIAPILEKLGILDNRDQLFETVLSGTNADWVARGKMEFCEKSHDIDGTIGYRRRQLRI